MLVIAAYLLTIAGFYLPRYIIVKKGFYISDKVAWIIGLIHVAFIVLFALSLVLWLYNLAFAGYHSTSIIFILMIGTGVPFFLFRNRAFLPEFFNKVLSVICAFSVPALLICSYLTATDDKQNIYYMDENYRLEQGFHGIMASKTFPDLYVRRGCLEKRYLIKEEFIKKGAVQSIQIRQTDISTLTIQVYLAEPRIENSSRLLVIPVHL